MDKKESRKILESFAFPVLLWVTMVSVYFLDSYGYISIHSYGIRPRHWIGLLGIGLSPFIHGSQEHLFNNSVPIIVLGGALFYFYREIAYKTLLWIALMGGFWVWISANPNTNHIGMSGVIYGLVAFLFFSGVLRKHIGLIAISMLMVFLYGSLIWGIFPIKEGVSWEGHLWGGVSGVILAWYFRYESTQRKLYQWELDEIAEKEELERLKNMPSEELSISSTDSQWEINYHWVSTDTEEEDSEIEARKP